MPSSIQIAMIRSSQTAIQRLGGALLTKAAAKKAEIEAIAADSRTPLQVKSLTLANSILDNGPDSRAVAMMPGIVIDSGLTNSLPFLIAPFGFLTTAQEANIDTALQAAIENRWDTVAQTMN